MAAVAPEERAGVVVSQDPWAEGVLVAALLFAAVGGAARPGGATMVSGLAFMPGSVGEGCGDAWVKPGLGRSVAAGGGI